MLHFTSILIHRSCAYYEYWTLRILSPSSLYAVSTDLDQSGPPTHSSYFIFIFHPTHCLPQVLQLQNFHPCHHLPTALFHISAAPTDPYPISLWSEHLYHYNQASTPWFCPSLYTTKIFELLATLNQAGDITPLKLSYSAPRISSNSIRTSSYLLKFSSQHA